MAQATLAVTTLSSGRRRGQAAPDRSRNSDNQRDRRAPTTEKGATTKGSEMEMKTRCVEMVVRARERQARAHAPIAAARLMSLLPAEWSADLRIGIGEIVLLIERTENVTVATVRRSAAEALADSALWDWQLVDCRDAWYARG